MAEKRDEWWNGRNGQMIHDPSYRIGYDAGYANGENSVEADLDLAFDEVADMDITGPMDAAVKVRDIVTAVRELLGLLPETSDAANPNPLDAAKKRLRDLLPE